MFRSLINIKTHIYFTFIQYAEIENTCMFSISAICLTKNSPTSIIYADCINDRCR
ncbi:hypothetical protein HMPREF9140_00743 [Prevotella micans F0438]|uniref:Uncharacterized protein n=1 Tax=Prevotella micans F0438 TaxID=883158 RepID=H1Q1F5_9BACT|nr:hypothetical protein HMPREF9140_00743 [Prevotella micans F0438]